MNEENTNKEQKSQESSSIENEDLMIMPEGGGGEEEEKVSQEPLEAGQQLEAEEPVKAEEPSIQIEPEKEVKKVKKKKKSVFDMRLKELEKKVKKGGKEEREMKSVVKGELKPLQLFIFKKKKSLGLILAKNIALLLIGLGIFLASLYFDNIILTTRGAVPQEIGLITVPLNETVTIEADGKKVVVQDEFKLRVGDEIDTGSSQNSEIQLPDHGIIRLSENTSIFLSEFNPYKNEYLIVLNWGTIWGNTEYGDHDMQISTENVMITPGNSSFNIKYDGSKTVVYANAHDVHIDIVANNEIINDFWIAESNQAQLLKSKITDKADTIKQLLYSKLIKEFNYGRIASNKIKEDPWLSKQISKDAENRDNISNSFLDILRTQGLKTLSPGSLRFHAKQLMTDLRGVLTFSEFKKIDIVLDIIFENLHDAQYLYYQGNTIDGDVRISLFAEDVLNPLYASNEYFVENLFNRLIEELESVLFIIPGDDLYPVKQEILKQLFNTNIRKYLDDETKFKILTYILNDVYDSVENSPTDAASVFSDYFKRYEAIVKTYSDNLSAIKDYIIHQNILVDNVLFQHPQLYKAEFFEEKFNMESDYLAALTGGRNKQEQRQTFISTKIDLLNRIRYYLFNDQIGIEETRQIVFLLIQNIEELQKETLSIAAVNELFEKRLEDFGIFWQYLNSPEYSTTPIHGRTHAERFEAFKIIQEEILTFQDIREEILGAVEEEELTVESILQLAEEDLESADIHDIEFGLYNDVEQTEIPISSAVVSGIEFRARYDWDRKIVSEIVVDDNLLSKEGVKLSNVKRFIFEAVSARTEVVSEPVVKTPVREVEDPLANVKNAAKIFLVEKFSNMGAVIKKEDINIKDFNKGEYEIKDIYFSENKEAVFSFEYHTRDDEITNLEVTTPYDIETVDDTFSSTFLRAVVLKIFEEARPKD